MIELIIKSYFSILLGIGASCLSLLFLGLYLIIKKSTRPSASSIQDSHITQDIEAIAGDDLFSTQLDLARAFIESDKKQFAKKILESIMEDGNPSQQQEARVLIGQL